MAERLINVFAYGDEDYIHSIGWRIYSRSGSFKELMTFLQSRVCQDHETATIKQLQIPIAVEEFYSMVRLDSVIATLFSEGIMSENDVYCITNIINGLPRIDESHDDLSPKVVPDYLDIYLNESGLDFSRLIYDDYFSAIHLLWSNKKYISCMKLVFSAVDTFGYVEYGPKKNCFRRWLDEYCDLDSLGITSEELWELRNSMIHMTNLHSHKVSKGTVKQLVPTVTASNVERLPDLDDAKRLHVYKLFKNVIPQGLEKWLETYNQRRSKILQFVHRYDTIVSEARMRNRPYSDTRK